MVVPRFKSLVSRWSAASPQHRRHRLSRASMRCQLRVAALEARTLLSTLTVTNDNDSGSGSLRAALGAAVAGETIKFARSAYGTITLTSGPLQVTSSVTIDGPGPNNVTISGNNTFQDLLVDANVSASVSGLTLTEGQGPAAAYPYGGGGIFNDGNLTVANCVISGNAGGQVGGAILNNASLTITGSVLSNNTATYGGGGIFNNDTLTAANCIITGNSCGDFGAGGGITNNSGSMTVRSSVVSNSMAPFGAGIQNNPGAVLAINGSTITNNAASELEGGIGNFGGTVKITNSVVSDNSAGSGGGGIGDTRLSGGGGTMTIMNSVISGNKSALENGGGILVNSGALTLVGSTLENNTVGSSTATFAAGGAVAANGSVTVNISGCLFAQNQAEAPSGYGNVDGGAVFALNYGISPANLNISNSAFVGNTATGAYAAYGGAVHVDEGVNVSVTATSFTGNTATAGGYVVGGAMDVEQAEFGLLKTQATIVDTSFQGNAAVVPATSTFPYGSASGGALFVDGSVSVSGSTFKANQAVGGPGGGFGQGGAIFLEGFDSTDDLSNSLLTNNSAIGGPGGGWGVGGGLNVFVGPTITVENTGFVGNQAIGGAASGAGNQGGPGIGGGVVSVATLTLTDCTLGANEAEGGAGTDGATGGDGEGGAIQNEGGTLTVTSSTVLLNEAIGGGNGGNGYGGGIYTLGTTTVTDTLVTLNQADGGSVGGQGVGGGLCIGSGSTTTLTGKTAIVLNFATTSDDNIYGTYAT